MIGQNLRYEVGTIFYKEDEVTPTKDEGTSNNTGAIIGGVAGSILSVLVVVTGAILIILVLFKRRTTAKATLLANRYTHQELVETKGGDLQLYIYKFSH